MILRLLKSWLLGRRIRAAGKRMTALGPATDSEWFENKSVYEVIKSFSDPPCKYKADHARAARIAQARTLKVKVWPVRVSGEDWYPTIQEWVEVQKP